MAPVGVDANGPQEAAHINTLRLSTTSCALSTPACLPTRLASPGYIFGHYGGVLQACPNMFETNCTSAAVMRFEDAPLMGIRVSSRRNSSSGTVPLGIGLRPAGCGLPARLGSARLGSAKKSEPRFWCLAARFRDGDAFCASHSVLAFSMRPNMLAALDGNTLSACRTCGQRGNSDRRQPTTRSGSKTVWKGRRVTLWYRVRFGRPDQL